MRPDAATAQAQLAAYLLQQSQALPQGLTSNPAVALERRLSVYRNNVFHSLTSALQDLYPVVQQLVGEAFFRSLSRHYLQAHPPAQAAMIHFGGDFPQFLDDHRVRTGLDYLADVARLELARHRAFHAVDQRPLAPAFFQHLEPETLMDSRLQLHASLQCLSSSWAVRSIWLAHRAAAPELGQIRIDRSEQVLIVRPDFEVLVCRADAGLLCLLEQLRQGATLGKAIEAGLAVTADFDPTQALAFCFQQGLFSSIIYP